MAIKPPMKRSVTATAYENHFSYKSPVYGFPVPFKNGDKYKGDAMLDLLLSSENIKNYPFFYINKSDLAFMKHHKVVLHLVSRKGYIYGEVKRYDPLEYAEERVYVKTLRILSELLYCIQQEYGGYTDMKKTDKQLLDQYEGMPL